jgi:hypothetical protein
MTQPEIEDANELIRSAVAMRRERQAAGKPHDEWYDFSPAVTTTPNIDLKIQGYEIDGDDAESCCDGGQCHPRPIGQGVIASAVHPTSQRFFDLCDELKAMHASKSSDYGCPSGNDPLANIRNGAAFVGIEPWKGAMVRLSDKVTRLATFNATGRLGHEGVMDTCLDLASYALLAFLLYEEETRGTAQR